MLGLVMEITALYFYPVKSLAGIRAETLVLESAGPRFDREWMVVSPGGKFVTQREVPKMQLLRTSLTSDHLVIRAGEEELRVPLKAEARPERRAEVWGTEVSSLGEGPGAAEFLTRHLGRELELVRILPGARQEGKRDERFEVRFADACPILVCSESSLADLRARAGSVVSVERFRPNIVVGGAAPFAEDSWRGLTVNNLYLKSLRACTRCAITTLDPLTAARGPEPLKTLATFRKKGNKVEFGQYFLSAPGELGVGMKIQAEA